MKKENEIRRERIKDKARKEAENIETVKGVMREIDRLKILNRKYNIT